jgi:peptide/nickel transport system permease protein
MTVSNSPWMRALRRLRRRKSAMVGLAVVLGFLLLAVCAAWIAPQDPIATSWSAIRQAPSAEHWFGTDEIGRDVLSRVIWGTQASLLAGLVSVSISLAIGVPLGLLAGFVGGGPWGFMDGLISRLTDAFLACPFLILAIALAAFLGPSLTNAMIAIGVSATPVFVRLTRAQVLNVKVEDYIEAARALGASPLRVVLRHVLPNAVAPLVVQSTLAIASAVIAEASLSFLGLGQQPPAPSWGSMLNTAKNYVDNAPWMAIWPGASIFLLVLSFNLLGDGLRDALDPKSV